MRRPPTTPKEKSRLVLHPLIPEVTQHGHPAATTEVTESGVMPADTARLGGIEREPTPSPDTPRE